MTATSDIVLERVMRLHPKIIDLELARTQRLLTLVGNPERKLPPVIHVAGTNGKGSVIAYLRAMLEAAGKRVHVYTSPHLVRFHERIRLAGDLIDEPARCGAHVRAETQAENQLGKTGMPDCVRKVLAERGNLDRLIQK